MSSCRNLGNSYLFLFKEGERRNKEAEQKRQEEERLSRARKRVIQAKVNAAIRQSGIAQGIETEPFIDETQVSEQQVSEKADRNCSTPRCNIQ